MNLTLGQYIKFLDKYEIIRLHMNEKCDNIGTAVLNYYNRNIKKIVRDIDCVDIYFLEE